MTVCQRAPRYARAEGGRKCGSRTLALYLPEKYQVLGTAEDPGDVGTCWRLVVVDLDVM